MTAPADPQGEARLARPRRRHSGWSLRLTPAGVVLLMMVNLAVLTLVVVGITRGVDWSQALAFLPGPWLRTPAAVGNTSTATLTRAALTPTPPEFPTATNAPARTASPTFSEAAETPQEDALPAAKRLLDYLQHRLQRCSGLPPGQAGTHRHLLRQIFPCQEPLH